LQNSGSTCWGYLNRADVQYRVEKQFLLNFTKRDITIEPVERENKDIFLMIAREWGIGDVFETKKKLDEIA